MQSKGGENLLNFITTEIIGGKLIIQNTNRCNFLRSYKKVVVVETLAGGDVGRMVVIGSLLVESKLMACGVRLMIVIIKSVID